MKPQAESGKLKAGDDHLAFRFELSAFNLI
jgi:hypothetical protein